MMRRRRVSHFAWIAAVYLLLTAAYAWVVPPFEGPDAHYHFFTARYIAENGRLPSVPESDWDEWMGPEPAQPPLYYVLAGLVLRGFDLEDLESWVWLNPHQRIGDASIPTNKNVFVHDHPLVARYAPAVYTLRALSVLLGLGTLACIYGAARRLWPARPANAVLAAGLTAVLPQFNFLHSYVNNDVLIVFLASAALYQLVRLETAPAEPRRRGPLVGLGITIGLAMLTKMAGLLLLGLAGLFVFQMRWRASRAWRAVMADWLALAVPALALAGWLYWRNWALYGDPTGTDPFVRVAGGDRNYTLGQVFAELPAIWHSLIAVFGWFNIAPPGWVYRVWGVLIGLAAVGGLSGMRRRRSPRVVASAAGGAASRPAWALLALWPLLVYAGMVAFMLRTPAAQGRLLLPAVLPLALALAWGLRRLIDLVTQRFHGLRPRAVVPLLWVPALATSVISVGWSIPRAYTGAVPVPALPAEAVVLDAALGDGVVLVGARLQTTEAGAGDVVWFDLYWRADNVPVGAPEIVVELFGRPQPGDPGGTLGRFQAYHGGGKTPANLWKSGSLFHSRLGVRLDSPLTVPTTGRVNVRVVGGSGVDIGLVKIVPDLWITAPETVARVGPSIALASAEILTDSTVQAGDDVALRVIWRADAVVLQDYTTLVHFGRPQLPPLAQADGPPVGGFYPTRLWAAGDVVVDNITLTIPPDTAPGDYVVQIGLYDAALTRLPLTIDGVRQRDDTLQLPITIVDK